MRDFTYMIPWTDIEPVTIVSLPMSTPTTRIGRAHGPDRISLGNARTRSTMRKRQRRGKMA